MVNGTLCSGGIRHRILQFHQTEEREPVVLQEERGAVGKFILLFPETKRTRIADTNVHIPVTLPGEGVISFTSP